MIINKKKIVSSSEFKNQFRSNKNLNAKYGLTQDVKFCKKMR